MAENKVDTVKERIQKEIDKIDKKENTIYFFVLDTKGNPSGSLEYIYRLAKILNDNDYHVTMLYQEEEEFIGVKDWLGEAYANLPHENILQEGTSVSPSDILFIPEIFANVMTQTKQLPCKRVAILQNYNYVTEQIPLSVQWGDLNILDAITNTEENKNLLNDIFPYVRTKVITPILDSRFYDDGNPKKMIVNLVVKDPSTVNQIIKPFYWTYPLYKWVTFRDLRGFSKDTFAERLREAAITIWVDDDASFGYSALEAMQSGSVVLAKLPNNKYPWSVDENGDLTNGCIWFENVRQLPSMIAKLVRASVTNQIPDDIVENGKTVASKFIKDNAKPEFLDYVNDMLEKRKNELKELMSAVR